MADRIADVLEQAAQYDERRDRRQRGDQCRERRPSEHLRDDDARDGQAGYAGDNGGQPDGSRQQDPQSQALVIAISRRLRYTSYFTVGLCRRSAEGAGPPSLLGIISKRTLQGESRGGSPSGGGLGYPPDTISYS